MPFPNTAPSKFAHPVLEPVGEVQANPFVVDAMLRNSQPPTNLPFPKVKLEIRAFAPLVQLMPLVLYILVLPEQLAIAPVRKIPFP